MKKRITALILCAIMGIMTAGCGGGDSQGSSQGQGQELSAGQSQETLIVLTGSDASTFDPHFCTDSATEIFNKNITTINLEDFCFEKSEIKLLNFATYLKNN